MTQPIPDAALDDRLGFVGTAGSGKSYNAMGRVERLLEKRARVACIDPLGVFWGLRLKVDGQTPSGFNIPIFGGPHGDLPLTEHSGALIGETVASMAESCVIDLSEIGTKVGERRFMLAFLTALYRKMTGGDQLHLVIDEADMFAPQKLLEKEGEAAKLLGMMETVVRRGRIKGFIPWLITQRPAVIAKDVLSQVDGLVAFKLTSSQDRDALSAWVEGSAEKDDWKTMRAALPSMARGQGLVWIPGRSILETVSFPEKITFDSSRTPKRGEKKRSTSLTPLDLGKLKERLATVDAETKANDPKALKAQIATLTSDKMKLERAAAAVPTAPVIDQASIDDAREQGRRSGFKQGFDEASSQAVRTFDVLKDTSDEMMRGFVVDMRNKLAAVNLNFTIAPNDTPSVSPVLPEAAAPTRAPTIPIAMRATSSPAASGDGTHSTALIKALTAMVELEALGVVDPKREMIAAMANYTNIQSRPIRDAFSECLSREFVTSPSSGRLRLTVLGRAQISSRPAPMTTKEMHTRIVAILGPAAGKCLSYLLGIYPRSDTREAIAAECGYSNIQSRPIRDAFSKLQDMGFVEAPESGRLAATEALFP